MREITHIVVHCSATPASMNVTATMVDQWHKQKGWSGIGYHFFIRRDGALEIGRKLSEVGAHVAGHNRNSIGICMAGGLDESGNPENNFTKEQFDTLTVLLRSLRACHTDAIILGHRDFPGVKKDCPCFDVGDWLKKTTPYLAERG